MGRGESGISNSVSIMTARYRAECQNCHAVILPGSDFWMITLQFHQDRVRMVRCLRCGKGCSYHNGSHLEDSLRLRRQDARIMAYGAGRAKNRDESAAITEMFGEVPMKRPKRGNGFQKYFSEEFLTKDLLKKGD